MFGKIEGTISEINNHLNTLLELTKQPERLILQSNSENSTDTVYVFQHRHLPFTLILYSLNHQDQRISTTHFKQSKPVIHLDEDVWIQKSEIVKNRLSNRFGLLSKIGARSTVVSRIDKAMAIAFQNMHHLQGALAGKYRYGLFYQGTLVAIAVFSGGRRMPSQNENYRSFELLHFCMKKGYQVSGGLSKLLLAFQRDFDPQDIMTYIDLDWAHHQNYEALGFSCILKTDPICLAYDIESKERQSLKNLTSNNWIPKWNSGSLKMVKRLEKKSLEK